MNKVIRSLLLLTLLAAPALCADQKEAKKAEAGAEAQEETVLTPFGPVKKQTQAPAPKPKPRPGSSMVDVEVADGVATFKRKTPFGVQSWKRPLDQLSADEQKLLDESREAEALAAEAAAAPEEKAAPQPR